MTGTEARGSGRGGLVLPLTCLGTEDRVEAGADRGAADRAGGDFLSSHRCSVA